MAIPRLLEIPPAPEPYRLTLPGGIRIEHARLADLVQPALAPLVPLFSIIDAALSLFAAIKAVPAMFGPPPDPTALGKALADLAKKIGKLLELVPQLSLPATVVGLLDLVLGTLGEVQEKLGHLEKKAAALTEVERRAAELRDEGLHEIARSARANLETEGANVLKTLEPLASLFALLGLFLGLVGGPELPVFSGFSGQPLGDVTKPLDQLATALRGVRAALPLP